MLLYEDHKASKDHKGCVLALAFSQDGSALVSAGMDGAIFVRDAMGQRQCVVERDETTLPVHAVACAPDGSLLAGGAFGWRCYRQDDVGTWQIHGEPKSTPTNALTILDDTILVVGIGEYAKPTRGRLELWDLASGRMRRPDHEAPNGVWAVAACSARRMVAWVTGHRVVRVWEIIKHKPVDFPEQKSCKAVAIHPEGTQFAVAVDYGAKIYNIEKQYKRFEVRHGGAVSAVAYSPDGTTLATGSWDQTVKLWDAETGRERATFSWSIGRIYCLAFAPDGLRLAAGGDLGSVVVWDMD